MLEAEGSTIDLPAWTVGGQQAGSSHRKAGEFVPAGHDCSPASVAPGGVSGDAAGPSPASDFELREHVTLRALLPCWRRPPACAGF